MQSIKLNESPFKSFGQGRGWGKKSKSTLLLLVNPISQSNSQIFHAEEPQIKTTRLDYWKLHHCGKQTSRESSDLESRHL